MENKKTRVGLITRDSASKKEIWIYRDYSYSGNITLDTDDNTSENDYRNFLNNLKESLESSNEKGIYFVYKRNGKYVCNYACTEENSVFGYGNTPENALVDCKYNIKLFLNMT